MFLHREAKVPLNKRPEPCSKMDSYRNLFSRRRTCSGCSMFIRCLFFRWHLPSPAPRVHWSAELSALLFQTEQLLFIVAQLSRILWRASNLGGSCKGLTQHYPPEKRYGTYPLLSHGTFESMIEFSSGLVGYLSFLEGIPKAKVIYLIDIWWLAFVHFDSINARWKKWKKIILQFMNYPILPRIKQIMTNLLTLGLDQSRLEN